MTRQAYQYARHAPSARQGHHGGMRTVLITLIGPERTSDLVVDADTNVESLLPLPPGRGRLLRRRGRAAMLQLAQAGAPASAMDADGNGSVERVGHLT